MSLRKSRRYSYITNKKIEKIKQVMDLLAYGSLFFDVCISLVTVLSLLHIKTTEYITMPINYMLTSVVVMSLISIGMLLYLKHYEKIMTELLIAKRKIRIPLPSPRTKNNLKFNIKNKLNNTFKLVVKLLFNHTY